MWPAAGAADVEDASERAAAAVIANVAEDDLAFGGTTLFVEYIKYCAARRAGCTS